MSETRRHLPLLDDEPTLVDALDRTPLVEQVCDMVARGRPPQVLGVHGDWGAGKTSFLHQLQWRLTGECPQLPESKGREEPGSRRDQVTVVWFEAWRYQYEKTPVVALLQEIRSQLPWTAKVRDRIAKLGETAARSALLALEDVTKKIGIQASKIQQEGERWEKEHLATALPSHFIRQHLEREISRLIKDDEDSDERLVVIVDDLDRCEPAAAYGLLEGIKIYLNLPSCVFVLGMNQKVVEKAIADQLPGSKKDDRWIRLKAREYLEKICQNIVHLPLVGKPDQLLLGLLEGFEERVAVCEVVREHDCLPANPRQIKAFANLLRRNAGRLPALDSAWRQARLTVASAYLYRFHPDIYRHLEAYRHPYYQELHNWCRGLPQSNVSPLIEELERAWHVEPGDDAAPAPEPRIGSRAFPDPVEGGVMRAQKLIAGLDATKEEIDSFLLF